MHLWLMMLSDKGVLCVRRTRVYDCARLPVALHLTQCHHLLPSTRQVWRQHHCLLMHQPLPHSLPLHTWSQCWFLASLSANSFSKLAGIGNWSLYRGRDIVSLCTCGLISNVVLISRLLNLPCFCSIFLATWLWTSCSTQLSLQMTTKIIHVV